MSERFVKTFRPIIIYRAIPNDRLSFTLFFQALSFLIEDKEMVQLSDPDDEPAEAFVNNLRRIATIVVIDRVAASSMSESAKIAPQSATET